MRNLFILSIVTTLSGCTAANISSQLRESATPSSNMMTRCVNYATGKDERTNAILKQYDGWKLVYTSEYTTPNKTTTAATMCFERPAG